MKLKKLVIKVKGKSKKKNKKKKYNKIKDKRIIVEEQN